jgi:DNA-binding NarL/FixJ family response regulator
MNPQNKLNVVIADDNQNFLKAFRFTLEEILGDKIDVVYEACNGLECIVIAEKYPVNLIFIDLNMPVLDGIETIKRLKSMSERIKIVAVSFHKEEEFKQQAMEAGAHHYIVKENINRDALLEVV